MQTFARSAESRLSRCPGTLSASLVNLFACYVEMVETALAKNIAMKANSVEEALKNRDAFFE